MSMWEFHQSDTFRANGWSWKRFLNGRLRQSSVPVFESLAEAIGHAGKHGFEAHCHRWDVFAGAAGGRRTRSASAR